ncbi:response regulator [Sphingobacterium psychroaquaticum]|uniref:Two component transcriptional regulator, LuxR family n=1 Tax=Sphingobacterium psychroaquaticum TaxID=561061 RepID=A0A1X7JIQ1_9SPHI|nr:response regulator transcription factor [Sphingobacterium psychroaquaticum]SMG27977.1 two component transcriptional regulator, LuxR family [Sphingobacterium psychroaquaticum]
MINIAITDDHPLLLEGLKNILSKEEDFHVIGCFPDAKSTLAFLSETPPQVLLLDINLPDANSLDLVADMKRKYPDLRILIISVHNEYAVIKSMLDQGANGYVQKNSSVDDIVTGIKTILLGDTYVCSQTKFILESKQQDTLLRVPKLTRREKEILQEAAQGFTTIQIAERLFISPHTVESHRKNLIEKFSTKNLSSVIKLALEYGLIRQ